MKTAIITIRKANQPNHKCRVFAFGTLLRINTTANKVSLPPPILDYDDYYDDEEDQDDLLKEYEQGNNAEDYDEGDDDLIE